MSVFIASNDASHDFGYVCGMPKNIVIDGLEIEDTHCETDVLYCVFPNYNTKNWNGEKPYPYGTPENVTIRRVLSQKGGTFIPFDNPEQYPHINDLKLS